MAHGDVGVIQPGLRDRDDVHPSVAGHRLYARFLADNLSRLLVDDPVAPDQAPADRPTASLTN